MSRLARLIAAAAIAISGVAPAAPAVQALESGHCERYQGQFYVSPCPEFEGVTVDGFGTWHEGFNIEVQQYWVGSMDWGLTLTAHANCSDTTESVSWGLVEYTGGPFRDAMAPGSTQQTAPGAAATLKIKDTILDDFGFHYLRVAASCNNGSMERNDPAVGVQDWTYLGVDGLGDPPPPSTNHDPSVSCTATRTGPVGRYHFVANGSDADGDALAYTWTFGDGSPTAQGDNTTHDFAKPGPFASSVTVADGKGGTATGPCPVTVPAPTLRVAIQLPDRDDGRVLLDETFPVVLSLSADADGVGSLDDVAFQDDALRLSPDGHLEIVDGPTPAIPASLVLQPGGEPVTFAYDVHVLGRGLATLATRVTATDAAGRTIDSGEIKRNVSAPSLKVTITPEKDTLELEKNTDGTPKPTDLDVEIAVENVTGETIDAATLGPMDLAAADPSRTYDPFPAEITGDNAEAPLGAFAPGERRTVVRHLRITADGRIRLSALVTSDAGNAADDAVVRADVQTLLRMTIDGNTERLTTAGSIVSFFGRFTNVTNERTVAITDPMKARQDGNLLGSGMFLTAAAPAENEPPVPLIGEIAPGGSVGFRVTYLTERPTVAAYDRGTANSLAWTRGHVDFNVWVRAAVEEDDETWGALGVEDDCFCPHPESVVIEGGDFAHFTVVIDTTEPVSDGGQFAGSAFGLSVGALAGAQGRLSGLLELVGNVGRFFYDPEFLADNDEALRKSRLWDALSYLSEVAVWLPDAEADELATAVGARLETAYGAFRKTVTGGIPRPEETETAEALSAMARDYLDHLRGAWRRGDPNELIDAVMPAGGIVGEQVTDALVGEVVFEALANLAKAPRYYELAKQSWQDARTIETMQDKLPSLAHQADLLDANELSKSNFINLENAYQARRELTIPELGGAENGAGLARDTIATAQQWTQDNPNMVIVLVPNEPRVAALRDAGLAVGKIENLKPKSMASIERLVFGGRDEDLNAIVLRRLDWTTDQVDARVDELIAAGELAEEDRAVAKQILKKRTEEWKVFTDRGVKNPTTGEVTPDKDGIGRLKAYDETGKIPNQFRGEDNGVAFSGPEELLDFKLEYYKDGQLLPPDRIAESDYVVVLQEHPTSHQLVKVTGDDDGIFMGKANGLGLASEQLDAAYRSVWEAFNHPFTDSWLAHIGSQLKAKLKIFSRYFTVTSEGKAGAPLVAAMNGKFYAVKIDPYLSRFDPATNRAFIKWIGLPEAVDPINPGGWINAVLRPVRNLPWPATFLRSFLHIPGAATNPDIPPIPTARRARVLRVNEVGHVESWTPTTGWRLDPAAEAAAADGTISVAPQTVATTAIVAGATRIEITDQDTMGLAGDWFEIGDRVVLDPGGPNEETATIAGFGSLLFTAPLSHDHAAGELITLAPTTTPETTIATGPAAATRLRSATFTFSSDVPGATFECRLDSGAWTACASGVTYGALADGEHTFRVRAVAGVDVDPAPATATWIVDTVRPTITIGTPAAGATFIRDQSVTAHFSCSDGAGSGIETCSGPTPLDTSTLGRHTFTVTAADAAGNTATRSVSYTVVGACTNCRLVVSPSFLRNRASGLDGAKLFGAAYIFVTSDPSIRSVRFVLDGSRLVSTDSSAPFDFLHAGNLALPFIPSLLPRGSHTLVATVRLIDGSTRTLSATFRSQR